MEQTKLNELFRGDYMAWGLAEFDAEQRGYKEGVSDGISQGEHQAKIETAKNMLRNNITLDVIVDCTALSIEEINLISNNTK